MTTKHNTADLWEGFSEAASKAADRHVQTRRAGLKDLKRIAHEAKEEINRLKGGARK